MENTPVNSPGPIAMVQLPFYWSAWRDELRTAGTSLLSFGEIMHLSPERFDQLTTSERIFVDFFPDELPRAFWDKIKPFRARMIFLPPKVLLPSVIGKRRQKPLLLSDGDISGLLPPTPQPVARDVAAPSYTPVPMPAECFDDFFDFVADVALAVPADLINAPAWVLMCSSPQVEHALYSVAHNYGIRVAFWSRAYSSPLRFLAGYDQAFNACVDKTVRERLRRVKDSHALPNFKEPGLTLDQVIRQFNFPALGLDGQFDETSRLLRLRWDWRMLPDPFTRALVASPLQATLGSMAQYLSRQQHSLVIDNLSRRVWQVLVADLLSEGSLFYAYRNLAYAFFYHPQATFQALLDLLDLAFNGRQYPCEAIKIVLYSIVSNDLKGPSVSAFLDFLRRNEAAWLTVGAGAFECEVKALLQILEGGEGIPLKPGICADLLVVRGVLRLRAGDLAAALDLFRQEISQKSISDIGWSLLLDALMEHAPQALGEFFTSAVSLLGYDLAMSFATARHAGHLVDPDSRAKRQTAFRSIDDVLRAAPDHAPWKLYVGVLAGHGAQSLAVFSSAVGSIDPQTASHVSFYFVAVQDFVRARDILSSLDISSLRPSELCRVALLSFIVGLSQKGNAALEMLCRAAPCFWRSHFLDATCDENLFLLGIFARATGEESLAVKVLSTLDFPANAHYQAAIRSMPYLPDAVLPRADLKRWILNSFA